MLDTQNLLLHSVSLSFCIAFNMSDITACVRSRLPLDCGWNEVVFMCLILNASSYRCISSLMKLCPLSVNIRFGAENI